MFWYETQFKHAEAARARNKREERLLKIEIERRNGMRAVYESQVEEVSKQQRRIKRELEKIRKGSDGPTSVLNKPTRRKPLHSPLSLTRRRKKARVEQGLQLLANEYTQEKNEPESGLMRAIMLIGCSLSKKENNEDTYICNNELTSSVDSQNSAQRKTVLSNHITGVGNSITHGIDKLDFDNRSLLTTENISLQGLSTDQRTVSPALSSTSTRICSYDEQLDDDHITQLRSYHNQNTARSTEYGRGDRIRNLDLLQLAKLDMKSVKSNVSRRLSGTTAIATQPDLSKRRTSEGNFSTSRYRVPAMSKGLMGRRGSEGSPSPLKQYMAPLNQQSKDENQDAVRKRSTSKKSVLTPSGYPVSPEEETGENDESTSSSASAYASSDEAWDRARKARYLRTNDPQQLENERELNVEEIFEK